MIPVDVLTGFLGSGKTSLLRSLLRHPAMGRAAVVVNEFGEVGIDHDLLASSDETVVSLANGCLCCRVLSDLGRALGDLEAHRRASGRPPFERVVVETSGLADPAPILHTLAVDAAIRERYALGRVVVTVDGVLGPSTLEHYVESARQVATADCVVVTKCDLVAARPEAAQAAVHSIRPDVPVLLSKPGALHPHELFAADAPGPARGSVRGAVLLPSPVACLVPQARHSSGFGSVSVVRTAPLHAATLPLFLSALGEAFGSDLVRMKGIVAVAEHTEAPAVIHGVQHLYAAPEWLPAWPAGERSTRIVCIGRRLDGEWIGALLDLLDDEVVETSLARGARPPP